MTSNKIVHNLTKEKFVFGFGVVQSKKVLFLKVALKCGRTNIVSQQIWIIKKSFWHTNETNLTLTVFAV